MEYAIIIISGLVALIGFGLAGYIFVRYVK